MKKISKLFYFILTTFFFKSIMKTNFFAIWILFKKKDTKFSSISISRNISLYDIAKFKCKKNKKRRKPERNSFRSWKLIIQRPWVNERSERIFGKKCRLERKTRKRQKEREREKRVFYGSEDRRHGESTGLLPFVRVIEQNSWST